MHRGREFSPGPHAVGGGWALSVHSAEEEGGGGGVWTTAGRADGQGNQGSLLPWTYYIWGARALMVFT